MVVLDVTRLLSGSVLITIKVELALLAAFIVAIVRLFILFLLQDDLRE